MVNPRRVEELEKKVEKLEKRCCCLTPKGPFADDAAAEAGGVSIGELYYSADGSTSVRIV